MFIRPDWTLFRSLDTLGQKAGVPRERLAALVLKELADNALDAGAEASVRASAGGYEVIDNGPGIPGTDAEVAALFSIKRPLTSSKLLRLPTRGALGNGLRVVAGAVLASGGTLRVATRGRWLLLSPQDNGTTLYENLGAAALQGTTVRVVFGRELAAQEDPTWMAKLANAMRGESRYEGLSSPWWYNTDSFYELLQAAEGSGLHEVVSHLAGGKAYKKNPNGMQDAPASSFTREEANTILSDLRCDLPEPKHTKLGVVGESAFGCQGYVKKTATMVQAPAKGNQEARIPCVIEVWATKLEKTSSPSARIYINRTPITAKVGSWMRGGKKGEQAVTGCGLNHWFSTGRNPMELRICVTAPYMPITTDGKEPNLAPIFSEVNAAIEAAAGKAKRATSESRTNGHGETKADLVYGILDEAIKDVSSGGTLRYSLRNLYYACRPLLAEAGMEDVDNEMKYTYFSTVIGKIEAERGSDLPGMYRDSRGALQHPHEQGLIPLGTISVEQYTRPAYRFNKVLYVEKGGFMPVLADAKWGERHDCAVFTSQGFASRAARDLLDLLGETEEDIEFFCAHDADSSGTLIFQALVEGTLARPGRRVKVTNLGLEPWEAADMGLQSEAVQKKTTQAVAGYVTAYDRRHGTRWAEWLQENRYELNAMKPAQFLSWLDAKMEDHSKNTKVVPPYEVLVEKFTERATEAMRNKIVEELIKKYNVEGQVALLMAGISIPTDLDEQVITALSEKREYPWGVPLAGIAEKAAEAALEAREA